ncbi:ABC transporter substrate-binding protein [Chloroflexota bacterium]
MELSPENIIGDLAERWEVSPDGKVITFYLHQGVRWHDGQPFTADDVVYSINKILDPERSVIYDSFPALQYAFKVDAYTVELHLKYASPSILSQLAGPYAVMEAAHYQYADPKSTNFLMGTGPFKFKNYTEPVEYELVKNDDYFKEGLPYLDGVKMSIITNRSTQVDVLVANRVDMGPGSIAYREIEQIERIVDEAPSVIIQPVAYPYSRGFWANMDYAPLQDVRVRRALSLLMDPEEVVMAGWGSPDFGWTGKAIFPAPWNLPEKEIAEIMWWDRPFEERIAEAQRLMVEAGYPDGFPLRMVSRNRSDAERVLTVVADNWRRHINIQPEILMREVSDAMSMRNAGDFDLYWETLYAMTGDMDEYISIFLTDGGSNYGGYSNPALDKLLNEQSVTMDFAKRQQLAHEIERITLTDLSVLPGSIFFTFVQAWQPYVKGYVPGGSGYSQAHLRMENIWLDK